MCTYVSVHVHVRVCVCVCACARMCLCLLGECFVCVCVSVTCCLCCVSCVYMLVAVDAEPCAVHHNLCYPIQEERWHSATLHKELERAEWASKTSGGRERQVCLYGMLI